MQYGKTSSTLRPNDQARGALASPIQATFFLSRVSSYSMRLPVTQAVSSIDKVRLPLNKQDKVRLPFNKPDEVRLPRNKQHELCLFFLSDFWSWLLFPTRKTRRTHFFYDMLLFWLLHHTSLSSGSNTFPSWLLFFRQRSILSPTATLHLSCFQIEAPSTSLCRPPCPSYKPVCSSASIKLNSDLRKTMKTVPGRKTSRRRTQKHETKAAEANKAKEPKHIYHFEQRNQSSKIRSTTKTQHRDMTKTHDVDRRDTKHPLRSENRIRISNDARIK